MLVREQQEVKAGQKKQPWVAPEPVQHACILKFVTGEIRKPAALFAAAINRRNQALLECSVKGSRVGATL